MEIGLLYFREYLDEWPQTLGLERDYNVIELAALRALGINNHLLRWMYRTHRYTVDVVREYTPYEYEVDRKVLCFPLSPSVVQQYRAWLKSLDLD
jgi:hypothetical protein